MKTTAYSNLAFGKYGENLAKAYLLAKKYEFICQNWRYKNLELDLVFKDRDNIVFVEVKTRKNNLYGGAAGAVTTSKKIKVIMAAQALLIQKDLWQNPYRFDIVCITGSPTDYHLEHYINAFDAREIMDSGNANWQY